MWWVTVNFLAGVNYLRSSAIADANQNDEVLPWNQTNDEQYVYYNKNINNFSNPEKSH